MTNCVSQRGAKLVWTAIHLSRAYNSVGCGSRTCIAAVKVEGDSCIFYCFQWEYQPSTNCVLDRSKCSKVCALFDLRDHGVELNRPCKTVITLVAAAVDFMSSVRLRGGYLWPLGSDCGCTIEWQKSQVPLASTLGNDLHNG